MDTSKVALIAVVAALVGAVGGFFLGFAQRPEPALLPGPPSASVEGTERRAQTARLEEQQDLPEAARPSSLADAIAGIPPPVMPEGAGRIQGEARTENGSPLAGVEVRAVARLEKEPAREGETLEEEVAALVRRRTRERAMERTASTNAEGQYELTGLADAEYALTATLAGYRFEGPGPMRPGGVANFVAMAVSAVEFDVRLPDGGAPGKARLRIYRDKPPSSRAPDWTPARKQQDLDAGSWKVVARVGEYSQEDGQYNNDFRSVEVEFDVRPNEPKMRVEVPLRPCAHVKGSVVVPAELTDRSLDIFLQADPPGKEVLRSGEHKFCPASRTRGYAFRFDDVEPGRYRVIGVGGLSDSHAVFDWEDIVVASGRVEVTLEMPEPSREDFIVLRVLAPDGSTPKDVRFDRNVRGEGSGSSSGMRLDVRPDGTFWMPRATEQDVPENLRGKPWHYEIAASHEKYVTVQARYERDATHELVVQFVEPAYLTVQTTGFAEHPNRKLLFWAVVKPGGYAHGHNPKIEESKHGPGGDPKRLKAEQRFGPLEPGAYEIVLGGAMEFGALTLMRVPVTLAPGENSRAVAVPLLHRLTVTLPEGVTSRHIMIRPKAAVQQRGPALPDFKDGRSVIELLPDGEWVLFDGVGEMVVRVPGPAEVVFDPRRYDALRVNCQAGAWIELLGFRNDDVVVEVDGQGFKDLEAAWALITLSMSKEKTTWKVIRTGAELELAFDGRELVKLRDPKTANDPRLVAGYR